MDAAELKRILSDLSAEHGASHFGWTDFTRPAHFEIYREWLESESHGEMEYLERHAHVKEDPTRFSPAQSVITVAFPYRPHPVPGNFPLRASRVASYARGRDYHRWLRNRLEKFAEVLRERVPGARFDVHTDSSPLPERDLAARAGIGWIGRNTCLIHPKQGSFFLIGEILCERPLPPVAEFAPLPDFCGTCRRCVEACPTQALRDDRTMDARRCISYLSIEIPGPPPAELREGWGDWIFGCDICQSVCPWNAKPFRPTEDEGARVQPDGAVDGVELERELRWILTTTGKQLEKAFEGTALARISAVSLKRNAIVVVGNRGLHALRDEVHALREHPRLSEIVVWALSKIRAC